jgi:hypothetical protein
MQGLNQHVSDEEVIQHVSDETTGKNMTNLIMKKKDFLFSYMI